MVGEWYSSVKKGGRAFPKFLTKVVCLTFSSKRNVRDSTLGKINMSLEEKDLSNSKRRICSEGEHRGGDGHGRQLPLGQSVQGKTGKDRFKVYIFLNRLQILQ